MGVCPVEIPDDTLLLKPRNVYDKALIGVAHQAGVNYAVYSQARVIEAMAADMMTDEEAEDEVTYEDVLEHYSFNVSGSIGVGFPVFLMDGDDELTPVEVAESG
jgi:hypothetical protein